MELATNFSLMLKIIVTANLTHHIKVLPKGPWMALGPWLDEFSITEMHKIRVFPVNFIKLKAQSFLQLGTFLFIWLPLVFFFFILFFFLTAAWSSCFFFICLCICEGCSWLRSSSQFRWKHFLLEVVVRDQRYFCFEFWPKLPWKRTNKQTCSMCYIQNLEICLSQPPELP